MIHVACGQKILGSLNYLDRCDASDLCPRHLQAASRQQSRGGAKVATAIGCPDSRAPVSESTPSFAWLMHARVEHKTRSV
ncbi:unnamed protein product [Protopolystoma xenopodis]|uniref:Uncharacterized protein n=1 Tax=Protopolystoma xenopodis TaxID=117903 RepID=A0A448WP00_9PLAT|nr:unnamed protein product [Protopolystoma xenopodis]